MLIKFDWVPTLDVLPFGNNHYRYFKSFKFQVDTKSGNEYSFWTLILYTERYCRNDIRVHLKLEDASTTKYLFTTCAITLKLDKTDVFSKEIMHFFRKLSEESSEITFEGPPSSPLQELFDAKTSFEIICNINVSLDKEFINCEPKITFDVEKFLNDGKFSDFTVITPTKKFKVHKVILAAKSEVFSAMFNHDMVEKKANSVTINEFDEDVIKEFLRYMYCGQVENIDKLSTPLLKLAAMYFVDGLKIMCLENICEGVNFKNAVDILVLLSVAYKVDYLKSRILNYIVYNIKHIDRASINDLTLLQEIFEKTIETYV